MNRLVGALLLTASAFRRSHRRRRRAELWAFTGPVGRAAAIRACARMRRISTWPSRAGSGSTVERAADPSGTVSRHAAIAARTPAYGDRDLVAWRPVSSHSIRALARDDARLARAASAIANHAAAMHYAGLVLDFESLDARDLPGLLRVVKAITDSAHAHGVSTIAVAIPAVDAAYPAKPIAGVADLIMPMLYDQHWSTSGPGAISVAGLGALRVGASHRGSRCVAASSPRCRPTAIDGRRRRRRRRRS